MMKKRERILGNLQDLILTLRDKGKELKEPHFFALWSAKWLVVKNDVNSLSEKDRAWLDIQHKEWFEKEILPKLNEAQKKLLKVRLTLDIFNNL